MRRAATCIAIQKGKSSWHSRRPELTTGPSAFPTLESALLLQVRIGCSKNSSALLAMTYLVQDWGWLSSRTCAAYCTGITALNLAKVTGRPLKSSSHLNPSTPHPPLSKDNELNHERARRQCYCVRSSYLK